ncbi:MAG: preprotein translocase subunit SecA [Actinomycetota bacterium]|nr:preprotein translocase subunit SecA [Actinomycetota bacterium]
MSVLTKVLRAGEGRKQRRLAEIVPLINDLAPQMEAASDEDLQHATIAFRERIDRGESLDDLLVEAFAVVREAAWRVIGQRHFDVQLMGGMALHFGWIAEMKTGEGKTLVSTLPVYLNGLSGHGLHVVTVNDYLAGRDAEWMGRIHRWLGLSVGLVVPSIEDPVARRAAYACDVTYGTNSEFGFDYLRDNMARARELMVQRGHVYAIIDEVDSILIDEARVPLIISGPSDSTAQLYYQFAAIVATLKRDEDYEVEDEQGKRNVVPTESGIEKVEKQLGVTNLYDDLSVNHVHHLIKALEAKELYRRDKEYLVAGGEVKIVDEFTGRVLEGRRWEQGLHQAVEAKERVRIKEENHTWATVTLQNYFRLYEKLAGMTGTAETEAAEFANTYNLPVVPIPTNKPMIRVDHSDLIFKSEDAKFTAVVDDLEERYESGQPVLVGTASVAKSEQLSRLLDKRGIPHTVLNAKQHAREAEIVAQAGRLHSITVATNMAGRGVDIILGGNAEALAADEMRSRGADIGSDEGKAELERVQAGLAERCTAEGEKIRELGGLYVLGSERHESRRIDNQLRGRAGRQGDPGKSRFYLSLEDELMQRFATGAAGWVMDRALPEDIPIEAKIISRSIEKAQNTVEAVNAEIRKDVLKYDEVMDKQRKVIYARRVQILDGEDLGERTEELLEGALTAVVTDACPNDYQEEWDLERLVLEIGNYYPTKFTPDDLHQAVNAAQVAESVVAEALDFYRTKAENMPGGTETARAVEREVMLQVIDQRWKEHLAEMDTVREGINLRAMGQQDPLVAWQSEGFELFGKLLEIIDDDYVRYVMHLDVVPEAPEEPDLRHAQYVAAEDPVQDFSSPAAQAAQGHDGASAAPVPAMAGAAGATSRSRGAAPGAAAPGRGQAAGAPVPGGTAGSAAAGAKPQRDRIGRNDPCWCGSGKKFKFCHGAG